MSFSMAKLWKKGMEIALNLMKQKEGMEMEEPTEKLQLEEIYLLNIKEIDVQHQGLIDLINELNDLSPKLKSGEENLEKFNHYFKGIVSYIDQHFEYEEAFMEEIEFPGRFEHGIAHENFERSMHGFKDRYLCHDVTVLDELGEFLYVWLINHIGGEDRKFASFYHENSKVEKLI